MDNDSDSDVGDILNDLLANNDTEETEENEVSPPKQTLKELNFNFLDSTPKLTDEAKQINQKEKSEIYDDTLDSSDDEDKRCFEEQNYSNYGRDVKSLLKDTSKIYEDKPLYLETSSKTFDFSTTKQSTIVNSTTNNSLAPKDVYSDPFFGLRIVTPMVSSIELKARMNGKIAVSVSKVKVHINTGKTDSDWVIAGVLINKSLSKTSQKGSMYSIWKISDLSENVSTVCLFMFGSAYKMFWKTAVGTVIGVLNPNILESKESSDLATLSVTNPQRIMILGKSKDMGQCKSTKKNGDRCTSIINISRCEFCVYHVQKEYKKCSRRAELQSFSNTQKFSAQTSKNKSQQRKPFNNNWPEFNGVLSVKSKQLEEKDAKRLALLSGCQKIESTKLMNERKLPEQTKKDFEQMQKSRGWKAAVLSQSSEKVDVPISSALLKSYACKQNNIENKNLNMLSSSPTSPRLGVGCLKGTIDLSAPITKKQVNTVKSNAVKWVQENGKIKPKDPNKVRLYKEEKMGKGKKRIRESEVCAEQERKKPNILSDKFQELMQAKSAHTDLIERSYEKEQEKYFNKLEIKEKMEEKMLTTYKVSCKAVKCLVCKYTSFSASDMCKEQKHPLRVTDAMKRFFKCGDCGNRTVSLDRIPSHSCIKCGSSSWTRAAMMDERKTNILTNPLSIRGDEESRLGSVTKDASLNLLVPDKDDK